MSNGQKIGANVASCFTDFFAVLAKKNRPSGKKLAVF
jgi:hypothetical protein